MEHLELDENEEIIEVPEYRQIVKGLLPALKTLDGIDLTNGRYWCIAYNSDLFTNRCIFNSSEKPFRPHKKSKKLNSVHLQNTSTGSEKEDVSFMVAKDFFILIQATDDYSLSLFLLLIIYFLPPK